MAALDACWVQGYSRETCCDPVHGPKGNVACWDAVFLYDPCCTEVDGGGESATPGDSASEEELALEQSLGSKLDASLTGNNSTLAEIEVDLRHTLDAPENRSMASPMTRAFLALVLFRQGRQEEALAELQCYLENDFSISNKGIWVGPAAAGYHMHDSPFAEALIEHLRTRGARNIADFGCGLGLYVRDLRAAGFRAGGFDGNPSTRELTEGRCQQIDLSSELDLGTRWDWLLSLEVAEHIPLEFEMNFVGNLVRHACFGMVLSWGNQAGEGHVNVKRREEVVRLFSEFGFHSVDADAAVLRGAARLPWLQDTVLVLERHTPPAECGPSPAHSRGVAV